MSAEEGLSQPAAKAAISCPHLEFEASCEVARMEDTGQFMLHARVTCLVCNTPFQFLGLQPGLDMGGARVSVDGEEARMAISPKGARPSPFQRMVHGLEKFDG